MQIQEYQQQIQPNKMVVSCYKEAQLGRASTEHVATSLNTAHMKQILSSFRSKYIDPIFYLF